MARMSAEERRELLLEAAVRVMRRDGVGAATTRAIAGEAGMPVSTFHYCFRSRAEMLAELITRLASTERQAVFSSVERTPSVTGTLRSAVEGYLAHLRTDPGQEQMLLELTHLALRDPELAHLARHQYEEYFATATGVLEQVAVAHGFRWAVAPKQLARLVIAVLDGVTLAWLADHNTRATRAVTEPIIELIASYADFGELM